ERDQHALSFDPLPYTTLFRSAGRQARWKCNCPTLDFQAAGIVKSHALNRCGVCGASLAEEARIVEGEWHPAKDDAKDLVTLRFEDRKSTRLHYSHVISQYVVP